MKSIVITGAGGFIGSHLSVYLAAENYNVYAIVDPENPQKDYLMTIPGIVVIEGDVNDYQQFCSSLPDEPHAFLHFAWMGVSPDDRNEFKGQIENVNLSINAVKLAASIRAQKFIFPGSTMEYIYYGKPINECAIPSPPNAYGVAKISAKYACSVLCSEFNIPFIYTVISGIYSEDRKDNNVIYYTIDKLLHREKPSFTALEQLWDYVHIDDVVWGIKLIIENGHDGAFYSLGHGDNWPLKNYIFAIRNAINPNLPVGLGEIPYPNGKMPSSCVDLTAIQNDTGYKPKIPFDVGIRRVIERIVNNEDGGN